MKIEDHRCKPECRQHFNVVLQAEATTSKSP